MIGKVAKVEHMSAQHAKTMSTPTTASAVLRSRQRSTLKALVAHEGAPHEHIDILPLHDNQFRLVCSSKRTELRLRSRLVELTRSATAALACDVELDVRATRPTRTT